MNGGTRFPFGQLVSTANALDRVSAEDMKAALDRHGMGDWGDLTPEDRRTNDDALNEGSRLLSSYKSSGGETFWIITEWDRSATTILLPEDY